jgi:hypothetical protein
MRKQSLARSSLSVIAALGLTVANPMYASADSRAINFEAPTYSPGTIYMQDGWAGTGGIVPINPLIDQAVVTNTYGYNSFGGQSWRISNYYTNGSFGDWPFSPSLADEAGETSAMNGGLSGGTRQSHFGVQWDFASTVPGSEQEGLQISTSPDRGDGARMSFIRMKDLPGGLSVEFSEYLDNAPYGSASPSDGCGDEDEFRLTTVASGLNRAKPHTVKLTMAFIDGPRNDVVKVWVDGKLVHTGTSWEDYFRWCEGTLESRTVDSMIFQARTSGGQASGTFGKGFLIDNLSYASTSGCHVGKGEGNVGTGSGKAHFKFEKNCADKDATVEADRTNLQFQSTSITSSSFDEDSQTLTIIGTGLDNGLPVTFTMTAVEAGNGLPSTFALILSDGVVVKGPLLDGGYISLE